MTAPSKNLPVWEGRDFVLNTNVARQRLNYCLLAFFGAVFVIWFLSGLVGLLNILAEPYIPRRKYRDWLTAFNVALVYGGGTWGTWRVLRLCEIKIKIPAFPAPYYTREWKLYGNEDGSLDYHAGAFSPHLDPFEVGSAGWSVPLDDVARVETGRTAEWIPHRAMSGGPLWASGRDGDGVFFGGGCVAVPSTEYQAFLFLNDGSRRVISTLHNGRGETSKLAASVRAWVEARRAAPPEERVLLQSADERREGFDL